MHLLRNCQVNKSRCLSKKRVSNVNNFNIHRLLSLFHQRVSTFTLINLHVTSTPGTFSLSFTPTLIPCPNFASCFVCPPRPFPAPVLLMLLVVHPRSLLLIITTAFCLLLVAGPHATPTTTACLPIFAPSCRWGRHFWHWVWHFLAAHLFLSATLFSPPLTWSLYIYSSVLTCALSSFSSSSSLSSFSRHAHELPFLRSDVDVFYAFWTGPSCDERQNHKVTHKKSLIWNELLVSLL